MVSPLTVWMYVYVWTLRLTLTETSFRLHAVPFGVKMCVLVCDDVVTCPYVYFSWSDLTCVVNASRPQIPLLMTSQAQSTDAFEMDWSLCVFCQKYTKDPVICPANAKNQSGNGYATMASNLQAFYELGQLPMEINLSSFGGLQNIFTAFESHRACWHKSCSLKFNNNMLQRAKKRRLSNELETSISECSDCLSPSQHSESKIIRSLPHDRNKTSDTRNHCFVCEQSGLQSELRCVSTFQVDKRVRACALKLQDSQLLAKLSTRDLMAQDAKYHPGCLSNLYRKAAQRKELIQSDDIRHFQRLQEDQAFAQLKQYVDECRHENIPVLKLSTLSKVYSSYLKYHGLKYDIHSTRLKNKLLEEFPDLQAYSSGRETLLAFTEHVGDALRSVHDLDIDDKGQILCKAAQLVRKDILAMTHKPFAGAFDVNCQTQSIPLSLLSLVEMILEGTTPNSKTTARKQTALSLSQLLVYNCSKRAKEGTTSLRHNKDRETPLHLYIGMTLHAKTRKRDLIDFMYHFGMSVSYDRVLEVSTEVANAACHRYIEEQVVCPPKLKFNLFTTSAIDNIDHNPSSTTAQGSFHGTGISIFQHPSKDNQGVDRTKPLEDVNSKPQSKSVRELPAFYEEVPPVILKKDVLSCPKTPGYQASTFVKLDDFMEQENEWLTHVNTLIKERQADHPDVSWAVYHAKKQHSGQIIKSISCLLPLFTENADSAAMLKHGMDMIAQATSYLNPRQTPVIAADQPLYATMKQIQWQYPATHGEDKIIIMMGGLHIEMAFLKVLGNWLMDSGWTDMIVAAQIASSGTADSFLRGAHVRRTRRAHEITACALYHLLLEAHGKSQAKFEDWINTTSKISPTFHFWLMVLNLELLLLSFVGCLRSGNFCEYIRLLEAMTPWMFAFDHTNYARWMPVHIRDLKNLNHVHPNTSEEFKKGNFVVHKTERAYSAIPMDHAHEQNNASVKGDGGAIGLTENASSLRRWTVGGPEVNRILEEFDASLHVQSISSVSHHEQSKGMQESFYTDVIALTDVIREFGSPFLEHGHDLLVISTRDIAASAVVETLNKIEQLGKDQYEDFVKERFIKGIALSEPIKKNKLSLLSSPQTMSQSSSKMQVVSLKNDCSLFSRLYIACQTREGNLDEFFKHENQICPPSLSHLGMLRPPVKSQLLQCLEDVSCPTVQRPDVEVTILDGAAVVNMMKPGEHKTFSSFSEGLFTKYLENQLENTARLDMSGMCTRQGHRRRVEPHSFIPHNWKEFLRSDNNKTELFQFLGNEAMKTNTDKLIISTVNETALSNKIS